MIELIVAAILGFVVGAIAVLVCMNREMDRCYDWCQWTHCELRQMKARLEAAETERMIAEAQIIANTDEGDSWRHQ